jgi:hypothetical protein
MELIGRDKELAVVREHLRTGKNLVVSGAAGVGKTVLVREAAQNALYCADTSTLKTACESLLRELGLTVRVADNVARKRAILKATNGKKICFVFDHVGRVSPKLQSFLENVHELHPMIVVTRSLAWKAIGHLKMILYDFNALELNNLAETQARQLIRLLTAELRLPDAAAFERNLGRLSRGNPGRIIALSKQAPQSRYTFGGTTDVRLLDLDRRIKELNTQKAFRKKQRNL